MNPDSLQTKLQPLPLAIDIDSLNRLFIRLYAGRFLPLHLISALVVLLAGCMTNETMNTTRSERTAANKIERLAPKDTVALRGTVVKKDVEGGFFAIDGDDGKTYDPLNLPEAFQNNGLRIKATVRIRNDVAGIHMVGDIIEILSIEEQ